LQRRSQFNVMSVNQVDNMSTGPLKLYFKINRVYLLMVIKGAVWPNVVIELELNHF